MSARTKKFTPEIDAQLYDELIATAKKSGTRKGMFSKRPCVTTCTTLVPSQHLVRPEVMDTFEQSVARNRDLLERLAK